MPLPTVMILLPFAKIDPPGNLTPKTPQDCTKGSLVRTPAWGRNSATETKFLAALLQIAHYWRTSVTPALGLRYPAAW